MPSRWMGCVVCGARWVEDESDIPSLACAWCHSSAIAIEKNLTGETERIIKEHGFRSGIPDDEPSSS
jgi:hypothetical protein